MFPVEENSAFSKWTISQALEINLICQNKMQYSPMYSVFGNLYYRGIISGNFNEKISQKPADIYFNLP